MSQSLSQPNRKECGIALILVNTEGNIFCVEELIAKSEIGKEKGDYSFPWETQEPGEGDEKTLSRLILEEVDASGTLKISEPFFLGEFTVIEGTIARIYLSTLFEANDSLRGLHAGIEIEPLGFRSKEFLLSRGRLGVEKAFSLLEVHQQEKERV